MKFGWLYNRMCWDVSYVIVEQIMHLIWMFVRGRKKVCIAVSLPLFKVNDLENPIIRIILISIGVPLLGVAASSLLGQVSVM